MMKFFLRRKGLAAILAVAIFVLGYFGYKHFFATDTAVRYVTAAAQRGTLVVSLSGSGQVTAVNQVDIKPKAGGDVVRVAAAEGQMIKAGGLIAQLDTVDAAKAVRDAKVNLASAKLALEKLKQPADDLSILQAQDSLSQAKDTLTKLQSSQGADYQKALDARQNAQNALDKGHEDGFNSVASDFLDLPTIMPGLHDLLFASSFATSQWNIDFYTGEAKVYDEKAFSYRDDVYGKYQKARQAYDQNFIDYKAASRYSDAATVEKLIVVESYETTKRVAEAIQGATNLIQFYQDTLTAQGKKPQALSGTHISQLNGYASTLNSHLSSLLAIKNTIQDSQQTLTSSDRDIRQIRQNQPIEMNAARQLISERDSSLAKLKQGPDQVDIASQELSIKQRENALLDANEKLADYFIRAPFDAVVAKINIKRADAASPSVVAATLVTTGKLAEISLNEVDVAKVSVGEKATLTFDALPDLSLTGSVAAIDTVGTISQGVVTYNVKVAFDTQDQRVKPGMSVSAAIITDVKSDILLVPNSALKSQGGTSYVEVVSKDEAASSSATGGTGVTLKIPPTRQTVSIGEANDDSTGITNGLKEGDTVVVRTIQPSSTPATTQRQTSLFGLPGGGGLRGGGGGGGARPGAGGAPRGD